MLVFEHEKLKKILANKRILEKKLKVKIEESNGEVFLSGDELDRFVAERVLEALANNFSFQIALLLAEPDYVFEKIPVKEFTKKKNLKLVKARIIGTNGRTLELMQELSDCHMVLKENIVYIIGRVDKIKDAENALKSLIAGSKQASVYKYLEHARKRYTPEGLGLKNKENKNSYADFIMAFKSLFDAFML